MIDDAARVGCECVNFNVMLSKMNDSKRCYPGNAKESIYDIISRCTLTFEEEKS